MFGDIKDLLEMMKKSDGHFISLLKEMHEVNKHLKEITTLIKEQNSRLTKIEKDLK